MGKRINHTTLKTEVGQGGAVGRISRPAALPHHPTPKGGWVVVGQGAPGQSGFRGGADFDRFVMTISPFLTFAGSIL